MLKNVSDVISHRFGLLNGMMEHGARLHLLTKKVRSLLPEYIATHCIVASWEADKLIIHSTNAAAGTVLRYQLPHLLPLLQKDPMYESIKQVICHIRPPLSARKEVKKAVPPAHSVCTVNLLQSAAENVAAPDVQAALQRLAATLDSQKVVKP